MQRLNSSRLAWLLMVPILGAMGCRQKAEPEARSAPLQVTLAVQPAPYSGLIAVADEKGSCPKVGVAVKVNLYPSGLDALQAMMRGEAQVATVADIAFASTMKEDPSLRVIASIGTSTGSQIVARRDRNIPTPMDPIGKKIGYSLGTSSPCFLHSFLLTHHISLKDIMMVAVPPVKQGEAIATGEGDALSAFDAYVYLAQKQLGEKAVAWDNQNNLDG